MNAYKHAVCRIALLTLPRVQCVFVSMKWNIRSFAFILSSSRLLWWRQYFVAQEGQHDDVLRRAWGTNFSVTTFYVLLQMCSLLGNIVSFTKKQHPWHNVYYERKEFNAFSFPVIIFVKLSFYRPISNPNECLDAIRSNCDNIGDTTFGETHFGDRRFGSHEALSADINSTCWVRLKHIDLTAH